jgi:esterase/lipase
MVTTKKVTFKNREGHTLHGRLNLPEKPLSFGIFCHCFTCSKDITAAFVISKQLAHNGIAMLRFDFTGIGESGGDFSESSVSHNIDDVLSANHFFKEDYQEADLLIGHSLGGLTSLYASQKLRHLKGIVTLNAPYTTKQTIGRLDQTLEEVKYSGFGTLDVMGKKHKVNMTFLEDAKKYFDLTVTHLPAPLLHLHAINDDIIPFHHAAIIMNTIKSPAQLGPMPNANHILSNREHCIKIADYITQWYKALAAKS